MGDFSALPGDVGSIQRAAAGFGSMAKDLGDRAATSRTALATAISDWKAPRADDFRHVASTVVDEVAMASSAMGQAAGVLSDYATQLSKLQSQMTAISQQATQAEQAVKTDPDKPFNSTTACYTSPQAALSGMTGDADALRTQATRLAQTLASQLGQLVDLAVPKGSTAKPSDLARMVTGAMGVTGVSIGPMDDAECWAQFSTIDDKVFTNAPPPGSPGFTSWFASLTPLQRELASQNLAASFDTSDFNPYSTVQGGDLPTWAQQLNFQLGPKVCTPDNPSGYGPYGYFGGGTIAGPGGVQWPIVMPFYRDAEGHYFMADDGAGRDDGGIAQLDGHDPGWTTVSTYTGLNQYGSVSGTTKAATAFLIATGQELETTETDPGAVKVDGSGRPYAGNDVHAFPQSPQDKAYWDVTSKTMFPGEADKYVGPVALLDQIGSAAGAVHNLDSHAERQWYVQYQVNADGRTRAVVHTYSATPTEDGKTYVGSFANSFASGDGTTSEIPYMTRYNDYDGPVLTAAPDPDVEYSDRGEPEDQSKQPIQEKMNK